MAKAIEELAKDMLTQYKGKTLEEITTFDAAINKSKNKETNIFPEWAQQSRCYDKPIYSLEDAPSQKEIVWFDDWDGEWHNFKSYDELLRYVLNAYGFLSEDIEKISNEIPNARWDAMTLWEMRNAYTRGDVKTVEDIIKEVGFMKNSKNITMPSEDEVDKIFQEVDGQLGNLGKPLKALAADAIEDVFGICEDGSVDMAAHNRRYHPNGLNENTHCKYLKKGESAGEGKQDTVRPRNATENLQKSGFDLAEKWLKENGNILTFHATTKEDLDFMGLNDFAKEKMKKGHPLGREAFEKVVESVCRECQYLKRRFPNIRFGFDVLYPYEVSGSDIGGISALDRRSGFGCLIIGDENNFYRLVGNQDERAYRWVIRHELGHSLSSAEISKRFDDVIEKKVMEKYGKDRLRTLLKTIYNVGEAWLTANNAVEKTKAKEEIIADIFALYTAPEYKKGYLPKELEDFCEEMIKGEHLQQQNGMLAMDGMDKQIQYPRHLGYVEGLFESKAMHNPPRGSTRPYALNCIKDKWEFFDTIEERDTWAKKHEKECRRYTMEDARAWMEQELPKIVAHIKGKNSPRPSRDEGEKKLNEYAADAVEGVFGIGEDALDPNDPDFWMKHDRAKHGGHFDPETMTCKLREKYEQGEKIENLRDEMDDIEGKDPDVGSSGNAGSGSVTPEEDAAYMEAVEKGDMETAAKMVREVAARVFPNTKVLDSDGLPKIMFHGTEWDGKGAFLPGRVYFATEQGVEDFIDGAEEMNSLPLFVNITNPFYAQEGMTREDGSSYKGYGGREDVTGDDVTWGEDVQGDLERRGYDGIIDTFDGDAIEDDAFFNCVFNSNNIKSAAPVTYDDDGNVIPLSRRFDDGPDIRGDVNWQKRGDLISGSQNDIISSKNQEGGIDVQSQGDDIPEQADRDEMGGEQSQGIRAHSILAAASAIGRGVEGRVQESTRVRDKEAESAARITEYAKENGIWRDDIEKDFDSIYGTKDTQKNTEGGESIVWFDRARGVAVKAIGLDYYGSPTLALERVELHNKYFPHAPLNVVGFGEVKDTYGENGDIAQYGRPFNIIAEQPLIDATTELTKDEIRERLESMGFKVVRDNGDAGWDMETPDGLAIVSDLHERNVFGTRDGSVAVIDCDIRKRTKEDLAKALSKTHPNIDADRVLEHLAKFKSDEEKAREFRRILGSGKIDDKSNKSRNSGRKPLSSIVKMAMGQDSADHRMVEFRELMAKKFPDKDATAIISELGKMDSAEEQEAYIRSLFDGK